MHIRSVVLSVMFWLFAGTLAESEQRSTFGELESIFMDAFGNVKDPGDYSIVDPSGNFIRIRGPSQEKFLQELIMEAGRHVLYPPNEENGVVTGNGNYKIIDGAESRDTSKKETQIPRNDSEILYGCPHDCTYYKPVCGSDRRTYKSKCHLQAYNCRTNVTVSDWENCRGRHFLCPSSCLDISDPVCGPDGKIYRNICIMRKRNCGQILETQPLKFCYTANKESESLTLCPKDCQDMYQPVCGSDGVIYYNECFLKMRTCGDKVESVDMRECAHVPKCPTFCIPLYDPVCGSDGKLYINDCAMLKKNCGNPIQRMPKEFCADSERLNDATEE